MTAKVHGDVRSFPNNSAIAPYLRVKLTAGFLVAAAKGEDELGVLEQRVLATDTVGPVRLLHEGQTVRMVASEAIAANANVYPADGGKVRVTLGTDTPERMGVALEAASGDGSVIEVLIKRLRDMV